MTWAARVCVRPPRINIFIYRLALFLQSFLCNNFHTRHCLCNFPFSVSLFSPLFPSLSERAMNGWKIITITHIIEPSLWQVQLEEPFFHQPKWFHYRGFHIPWHRARRGEACGEGLRSAVVRGEVAGGEGWIIKVTVGIIILTMERASSTFFSSPPQKHRPWPFGTKNFEINGASTYNLFTKRERLVSTWQFSIIKTNGGLP